MQIKVSNILERIIWVLTVILLLSFTVLDTSQYISIILLGLTGCIFVLDFTFNDFKSKVKFSVYHIWGIFFAVFCLLSSLWANNSEFAVSKGITILQILICMSVLYNHYSRNFDENFLLSCIEYAGYALAIYTVFFYGIGFIKQVLAAGVRLDSGFANINSIGIACANAIIVSAYYIICENKKNIFKFPFMLISLIIVAASGSRKALVVLIIGITCLYLFKYTSKNIVKTLLKFTVILGILVMFFSVVLSMQMFDTLNYRMEGLIALFTGTGTIDHSAWLRQQYIKIGLEQFFETPFFGIGIDNARLLLLQHFGYTTYLHNNYLELLAGGGIVGTSIFYSIYIHIIYKLKINWSLYSGGKIAILLLMLLQLAMDFGAVSYYSKNTYFYIMIFFLFVKYNNRGKVR